MKLDRFKVFFLLLVLSTSFYKTVFSQIMPEDDYKKCRYWGIRLNTDGFGFNYKKGRKIDIGKQELLGFDFSMVKHPKEERRVDPQTGSSYILGKALYLFAFRPDYCVRDRLFRRANKDGIEINWLWAGGPTMGILKPYFIQFKFPHNYEPFDPEKHDPFNLYDRNGNVVGGGAFFRGFNLIKIQPGAHAKIALDFEWGEDFDDINSVEVGATLDVYFTKILLIPQAENKMIFFSIYTSINFGKKM